LTEPEAALFCFFGPPNRSQPARVLAKGRGNKALLVKFEVLNTPRSQLGGHE
jgi:hypothetical protein